MREDRVPERTLCALLREAGRFAGVGAALLRPRSGQREELAATGPVFRLLAETQFTLWEGPGPDAFEREHAVVGNVRTDRRRWPLLTAEVGQRGLAAQAHAVVPLLLGATTVGLVGAYRTDAGTFTDDDLQLMAAYGRAIGAVAAQRRARADEDEVPRAHGAPVAIAVGMLMSHLDVTEGEALARLRAHAFSCGTTLAELARDVVARRRRLSELSG